MNGVQQPVDFQANQTNQNELLPRLYVAIGIILVLVLAVLFILGIVWLAQNHAATVEALRNVMIIALALMSCIFGVVLLIMFVMVVRLVNMLEFEIRPILEKTNETLGTVQGTTNFVSQNVVRPVTRASSNIAGFRRGLAALFGNPKKNLPD
ncbi:MAG: hypothetical protein R3293_00690 [Candidatus Promineifilaceae bacterium]|nr:hypothetical protein [Candidatus Promineifilaceae bacterium]